MKEKLKDFILCYWVHYSLQQQQLQLQQLKETNKKSYEYQKREVCIKWLALKIEIIAVFTVLL